MEIRNVSELPEARNGWEPVREASINVERLVRAGSGEGWIGKLAHVFARQKSRVRIQARVFPGKFAERNPFNIPGPFYGAMTDTCQTGPAEAPANVMLDPVGQEFLYRQPSTIEELKQIFGAALTDPFEGYGADGNSNWSLTLIRAWWQSRDDLLEKSSAMVQPQRQIERWRSYLLEQTEPYLRAYAFFVEQGRLPAARDVLPDLV